MASSGVGHLEHVDSLVVLVGLVVGATQVRMLLPHWFGSDCPAHGLGRGVSRWDELTLCLGHSLPQQGALRLETS